MSNSKQQPWPHSPGFVAAIADGTYRAGYRGIESPAFATYQQAVDWIAEREIEHAARPNSIDALWGV